MRLTLQNGYPYPLPPGFDFDAHNPHMHFVGFDGVRHFEWLHTLTIEFVVGSDFECAANPTHWMPLPAHR